MNKNTKEKKEKKGEDEVERLLEAAQDELVLKLSVDSHMSGDNLPPDLDRRFQALKYSRPSCAKTETLNPSPPNYDHLLSRFVALKASSSTAAAPEFHPHSDDEDEVEKIIRWAKDAARLDPSPPSDDDDDDIVAGDGIDTTDDEDDNAHPCNRN